MSDGGVLVRVELKRILDVSFFVGSTKNQRG